MSPIVLKTKGDFFMESREILDQKIQHIVSIRESLDLKSEEAIMFLDLLIGRTVRQYGLHFLPLRILNEIDKDCMKYSLYQRDQEEEDSILFEYED